jgi:hypothetical protein
VATWRLMVDLAAADGRGCGVCGKTIASPRTRASTRRPRASVCYNDDHLAIMHAVRTCLAAHDATSFSTDSAEQEGTGKNTKSNMGEER